MGLFGKREPEKILTGQAAIEAVGYQPDEVTEAEGQLLNSFITGSTKVCALIGFQPSLERSDFVLCKLVMDPKGPKGPRVRVDVAGNSIAYMTTFYENEYQLGPALAKLYKWSEGHAYNGVSVWARKR